MSNRVIPLSREEIESYRGRVMGTTPFPGGPTPKGLEAAKAALDGWHARNLATIDARDAEIGRLQRLLRDAIVATGFGDGDPLLQICRDALSLAHTLLRDNALYNPRVDEDQRPRVVELLRDTIARCDTALSLTTTPPTPR